LPYLQGEHSNTKHPFWKSPQDKGIEMEKRKKYGQLEPKVPETDTDKISEFQTKSP
jgi:hypothetical protein